MENIKEYKMQEEVKKTPEQEKSEYLLNRLSDVYRKKMNELRETFGLEDDLSPKTPDELLERIASGKYTVPTKEIQEHTKKEHPWADVWEAFRWRDPAKVEDRIGFDVAFKSLNAAEQSTRDSIKVQSPYDALVALKKFEDMNFS